MGEGGESVLIGRFCDEDGHDVLADDESRRKTSWSRLAAISMSEGRSRTRQSNAPVGIYASLSAVALLG